MKTVFLKDGRMADLVADTEKGYLVDPYITWNDYEGQAESAPSGNVELVTEVFDTAPVELIEAEYKKVLERVSEQEKKLADQRAEFQKLDAEVYRLRNEKTNIERYIINREELRTAKRLIIWPEHQIAPRIMDGKESHKFTISYEIDQRRGEERAWCYKGYTDRDGHSWLSGSDYFDARMGIKIDLTDEEILALTVERIPRIKKENYNWKYALMGTPDEWLSAEYIEEKNALKKQDRISELAKAQKELEAAQKKLNELQAKELVLS